MLTITNLPPGLYMAALQQIGYTGPTHPEMAKAAFDAIAAAMPRETIDKVLAQLIADCMTRQGVFAEGEEFAAQGGWTGKINPLIRCTGSDLRAWRLRMGWTQAEAADALGMRARQISYFETDAKPIRKAVALACMALEAGAPYAR